MPKAKVAVEEYLHASYDPDCDYVDGTVEERNVGELDHGDFQGELVYWIKSNLRQFGFNAIPELRVQINASRYRVPDVVILDGKRPARGILMFSATGHCGSAFAGGPHEPSANTNG
jgi:hypothetical protein